MNVLIHNDQPLEKWREGVMTRMRMSALLGGRQLCIFDQFCDPGLGAPIHSHAVEEVLEVIEGIAELAWQGERYRQTKSVGGGARRREARLSQPREHNVACACQVGGSDLRSILR